MITSELFFDEQGLKKSPRLTILLIAHGSHDSTWKEPLMQLTALLRQSLPRYSIELTFMEFEAPFFETRAHFYLQNDPQSQIFVFPLFVSSGGHVKNDIVSCISQLRIQYPQSKITLFRSIGDRIEVLESISSSIKREIELF